MDVNARLPALATYMGHVDISSTHVYLQPTAELLQQVHQRFRKYYLHHIRHITRKYGAQAQVKQPHKSAKRVNPHTIRHTSTMHLLRAGNDINMVSYWLGHADINTTHVYVEIDMEIKQKMIARAGAPNVGKKTPWQRPHVLNWLNRLTKEPQICGLNY